MYISITNLPKHLNRREIKFAIKFFAHFLMSERMTRDMAISVDFQPIKNFTAEVIQSSEEPKLFFITINNKRSQVSVIKSLAHEIVHIYQYASGKMKDYVRPLGAIRYEEEHFDPDYDEYWLSPWEVEAYGKEVGLYQYYKTMKKAEKKESKDVPKVGHNSRLRTRERITQGGYQRT